jgi:hypothetical protein
MDILSILTELRSEKARLEEAILTIERLAAGSLTKRRGRPPLWMANAKAESGPSLVPKTVAPRKRRRFTAATRKRMAEAQRKRWAARKTAVKAA